MKRDFHRQVALVADVALIVGIVVMVGMFLRRDRAPSISVTERAENTQPRPPRWIPEWPQVLLAARESRDSSAHVVIATFLDVECPSCRRFHEEVRQWERRVGRDVALLTVHLPLPQHRFARPAARALECARTQSRFAEMLDALLAHQDSLGLIEWGDLARTAGVSDLRQFRACNRATTSIPGVDEGLSLARSLKVAGTPAVVVNGYLYQEPPTVEELERVRRAVAIGEDPFKVVNGGAPRTNTNKRN